MMPPHTLDVFFIGAEAPDWSDDPTMRVVPVDPSTVGELLGTPSSGVPALTLIDAELGPATDDAQLMDAVRALGPVVFASSGPPEDVPRGTAGSSSTVPRSLLRCPGPIARRVLLDAIDGSQPAGAHDVPAGPGPTFERFLRDALHEFRTPLTVIVEFASLCTEGIGGPLTDQQQNYLEHVIRAAGRLEEQFDDFRAMALLDPRPVQALDATDRSTALAAIAEAVSNRNAQLAVVPVGAWASVAVEADLVTRVVARVIDCATKWSRGDDPVIASVAAHGDSPDHVKVAIEYSGIAPAENDAQLLVDPPAVPKGSPYRSVARVFGLGMAMATSSLAVRGGRVRLEPLGGTGGRFVIELPTGKAQAAAAA